MTLIDILTGKRPLKQQISDLEDQNNTLQDQLDTAHSNHSAATKAHAATEIRLSNAIKTLEHQRDRLQATTNELTRQVGDLASQNTDLKAELDLHRERYGVIQPTQPTERYHPLDPDAHFFERLEAQMDGNTFDGDQIAAIRYNMEKHLRIIAGAGSGKTQTICAKAVYLAQVEKVPESQIFMFTFTKKAAKEMKERVSKYIGTEKNKITIGTFHGVFKELYRQLINKFSNLKQLGIQGENPKENQGPCKRLLKDLVAKHQLHDLDPFDNKTLADRISYWINIGYDAKRMTACVKKHFNKISNKKIPLHKRFGEMLAEYHRLRKEQKLIVFDDYLNNIRRVLETSPEAADWIRQKFRYIFVDEFQDTNPIQVAILKLLCPTDSDQTRLIIVGDDDQSIYAFRGSSPRFIKEFKNDYQTHCLELLKNYRSRANIVHAGNRLIAFNKGNRIEKAMIPHQKEHGEVCIALPSTERSEANWIIDRCKQVGREEPFRWKGREEPIDFRRSVVLYRSKGQVAILIEELQANGIPFVIENKGDLMGLFTSLSFREFFNAFWDLMDPEKQLSDAGTWEKMLKFLASKFYVPKNLVDEFFGRVRGDDPDLPERFKGFVEAKMKFYDEDAIHSSPPLTLMLAARSDPETSLLALPDLLRKVPLLAKDIPKEDFTALDALFRDHPTLTSLRSLYEKLKKEADDMNENMRKYESGELNALYLMTIHKSKGLAFDTVFVPGVHGDGLPDHRAEPVGKVDVALNEEKADPATTIEEERRLMYVAVTRARKNLFVSCPGESRGEVVCRSRFLKESGIGKRIRV